MSIYPKASSQVKTMFWKSKRKFSGKFQSCAWQAHSET